MAPTPVNTGAIFDPAPIVTPHYPPDTVIVQVLLPVPVDALTHILTLLERLGAPDATAMSVDGWLEFRTAPRLRVDGP
jgi:hypothetical protein